MSWKSIEREKSIEAHNYHMRQIEQEKLKIEKEKNKILSDILSQLSLLDNGKKIFKKDLSNINKNIQKLF